MSEPKTLMINDVEYVRKDSVLPTTTGNIRIIVLQRGWVAIGYFHQDGEKCRLENAAHIRMWGTTKGLGEIAIGGPTSKTVLDKCPTIRFHELTIIQSIDCVESAWKSKL